MSATPEGAFIIKTKTSFASKPPTSFSIIDCEQTIMYSRKSLDSSFGPYKVSICETNIKLEDGTLLSTKVWFPGQKVPFEAASHSPWTTYCEALDNCENEVSPTSKLEFSKHIHLIFFQSHFFEKQHPRAYLYVRDQFLNRFIKAPTHNLCGKVSQF